MSDSGLQVQALSAGVVQSVSFHVGAGERLMIAGPSGCGKSCLLKGIADLIPNTGTVTMNGLDRASIPAPQWRRQIQLVLAENRWWYPTAQDHFQHPTDYASWQAIGLTEDDGRKPIGHLSTGQKQRLALLRALQLSPKALLLDEPTSGLDDETAQMVEHFLIDYQKQYPLPIVWVSHQPAQIERVGTHLLRLPEATIRPIISAPGREVVV